MLKSYWYVTKREIKCIYKDKKMLIILLFAPLFYTSLFGYLYINQVVTGLNTAIVNQSPSQLTRNIVDGFDKSEKFSVKFNLNSEEELRAYMEKGLVDVGIIIPPNFTRDIKRGSSSDVLIVANGSNMLISNSAMGSSLQIVETYSKGIAMAKYQAQGFPSDMAFENISPISFKFRPWYNPAFNYTNFLLLGLISVAVQQICLMFVAVSVAKEKARGTMQDLARYSPYATPIVLGKLTPYFLSAIFTLSSSALAGFHIFNIPLRGSFWLIITLGAAFIICITALGVMLSTVCNNELDATQYSMMIAVPSFLFSGFTWPLQAMPDLCQFLARLLPLTYFAEGFRKIALMGVGFDAIAKDFYVLLGFSVLYTIAAIGIFKFKYISHSEGQGSLTMSEHI